MNNENYIVINGKKAELTEEQIKAFKKEAAEEKNPLLEEKSMFILSLNRVGQIKF